MRVFLGLIVAVAATSELCHKPQATPRDSDGDGIIDIQDCNAKNPDVGTPEMSECYHEDYGLPENEPLNACEVWEYTLHTYYEDLDKDTWGDGNKPLPWCDNWTQFEDWPDDASGRWGDCGPQDPTIHPQADDPPGDGIDQNCDGMDGSPG